MNTLPAANRDVAIVGLACRFPGADNWRRFWRNLREGVESIAPLSDGELLASGVDPALLRHPSYVKAAAAVEDYDCFDAAFFEYSRREARIMDPQHRLFLQIAWEALEDAGYSGNGHKGAIGVFAGAGGLVTSQFAANPALRGATGGPEHIGNDKDFIATRVSYKLNLCGPSMTVQTACSTSVVAVHLACSSIINGECDVAIAGASTIRIPQRTGYFAREGDIYSPDGHCRAFDAEARGTVFGSGAGALVLKHLADALDDGDHIYAVIRATAVNNDGAAKMSFTASSVPGQTKAMLEAFARCDVRPDSVGYVEAHGTGTLMGDPLEIDALTRAFRSQTDGTQFCAVGSVKTNIGHIEQAAGVAGLMKAALALYHREIPPSLNFRNPNPRIDFQASPFFVSTELRAWPAGETPRRAAVNSLGLGGTNAFAILEEARSAARGVSADPRTTHILTLSAASEDQLVDLAGRWRDQIGAEGEPLADLCHTSNVGRANLRYRLAAVGGNASEIVTQLDARKLKSSRTAQARKLAFLFPGQGSQYPGMTSELYRTQPVFRAELDRCEALLRPHLQQSLLDVLFEADGDGRKLAQTGYTQPALFAVEWSLAQLWMSWGIRPDAVIGHSLGEYVAACVAGVYCLADGLRLIAGRAQLMQSLPAGGAMAVLFADAETTDHLLRKCGRSDVGVAAYNAPLNTVISGSQTAVGAVLAEAKDIGARPLAVSHAFHSSLMLPILDDLEALAANYATRTPEIPVIANLTAEPWSTAPTPAYWREHALRPVRMAESLRHLARAGILDFLEVGPGSALVSLCKNTLGLRSGERQFLPSIAGDSEWRSICSSVANLWRSGASIDWEAFHRPYAVRRVPAPTYPFRRERHWLDMTNLPATPGDDILLGRRIDSPLPPRQFESIYNLSNLPWLADHRIFGLAVLPAASVLIGIAQAARNELRLEQGTVETVIYHEALIVPDEGSVVVQTLLPDDGRTLEFEIVCRTDKPGKWSRNVTGRIARPEPTKPAPTLKMTDQRPELVTGLLEIDPQSFYAALDRLGLNYGPDFRNIAELWLGDGVAVSRVKLPNNLSASDYILHPALLDACLHVYPALAPEYDFVNGTSVPLDGTYLPVSIERFAIFGEHLGGAWVHARRRLYVESERVLVVDIDIFSEGGVQAASLQGLTLRPLSLERLKTSPAKDAVHELKWVERPLASQSASSAARAWLVVGDRDATSARLTARLESTGAAVRLLTLEPEQTPATLEAAIRAAIAGWPAEVGCVLAHGLSTRIQDDTLPAELARAEETVCRTTIHFLQALAALTDSGEVRLKAWLVTCRAQCPTSQDAPADPLQAALWGLGRVAAIEQSRVWKGLIDISSDDEIDAVVSELMTDDDEDQVARRGSRRYALRLVRRELPAVAPAQMAGVCLVTGGLGALGLHLARWLVERGKATHLVLTSRSAPSESATAAIAALRALGATVSVRHADVCREEDVAALINHIRSGPLPLTSVFHCAGVLDDAILIQMDWEKYRRVTAPKVLGSWLLHCYTRDLPLKHFVMFSSVIGIMGAMGQANYAAGNAFLDGLVERRRSQGLTGQTINWGPWAEAGLAVGAGERGRALWRSRGTDYLPPKRAMDIMERIVADGARQSIVSLSDWSRWADLYAKPPAILHSVIHKRTTRAAGRRVVDVERRFTAAAPSERKAVLVEVVDQILRALLEIEGELSRVQPLRELGLDSLMAITLANQLEEVLGQRLLVGFLLKGPTMDELVDELASKMKLGTDIEVEAAV